MAHQFLADNGNDLVALAQILGQESLNTTARYTKRSEGELAAATQRLAYRPGRADRRGKNLFQLTREEKAGARVAAPASWGPTPTPFFIRSESRLSNRPCSTADRQG
jgi:hypothetical protein